MQTSMMVLLFWDIDYRWRYLTENIDEFQRVNFPLKPYTYLRFENNQLRETRNYSLNVRDVAILWPIRFQKLG